MRPLERMGRSRRALGISILVAGLLPTTPALSAADGAEPTSGAETDRSEVAADATTADETTFLDSVTVTSTLSPRSVQEVAGQVDVIERQTIEDQGYNDITDLVRYLPGVAVDEDPTRLGTSGFEIRGIGGNRVSTRIDGVPSAEQFDFGPFSVTRQALDIDTLESVEVVRSAGSALYGSDALGGVVSLETRGPSSYLNGADRYYGLRLGHDGRSDQSSATGVVAFGSDRWRGSLVFGHRDGHEPENQGDNASEDFTRTVPNPIDRTQSHGLLKLDFDASDSSTFEAAFELYDTEAETEVFSGRTPASPFSSAVLDFDALDTQDRRRFSLEQSWVGGSGSGFADSVLWRAFLQDTDTEQATDETRSSLFGRLSQRDGLLTFEQETLGLEAVARKSFGNSDSQLLTYGASFLVDDFDQLRNRSESYVDTGEAVPTSLVFPSKYFPESEVEELGLFVQAELRLFGDRLQVVPGLRFDRYTLDANQDDAVYLSGNPGSLDPVDVEDEAVSPKLGMVLELGRGFSAFAQYSRGFRAPPMNEVNNGFTNQGGGYRTLPNPNLEPETSDNFELGLRGNFGGSGGARGSFSIAVFENSYDDFIQLTALGFNPSNFLFEFRSENVQAVEISGIELAAEARFGQGFRIRGTYSRSEGDDEIADEPLASIAPARLVTGFGYQSRGTGSGLFGRWGAELTTSFIDSKSDSDLPSDSDQFRTPSASVVDLAAWVDLSDNLTFQFTVWNLGDETYWPWSYARGLTESSAILDRYTSSGRSLSAQLRLRY